LAARGYNLLLHYNTNQNAAAELAEKLSQMFGVNAEILQADLSAQDGADKLTSSIVQPIDAIVLNSGRSHFGLITDV
ncbi:EF-P-5 aminopentanone reductase, partial [Staphylococcus aureus]|nr:EF-P-5 aminopentanone reductase [Staphylococcus aureus]